MSLLSKLHESLTLKYGSFEEEFPEQEMSVQFIMGHENILEIGANIGRNSLIIASLLEDKGGKLVSLEVNEETANKLIENRNINNFNFAVEPFALSEKPLLRKGWRTIVSYEPRKYYKDVKTISWKELSAKYSHGFDTLVLDCEGAIYQILMDTPSIMDTITMVIIENDFVKKEHQDYVHNLFKQSGLEVVYSKSGIFQGKNVEQFYQVWKKTTYQS